MNYRVIDVLRFLKMFSDVLLTFSDVLKMF